MICYSLVVCCVYIYIDIILPSLGDHGDRLLIDKFCLHDNLLHIKINYVNALYSDQIMFLLQMHYISKERSSYIATYTGKQDNFLQSTLSWQ